MSFVFFFKQKTAYEMRISDWSSDVCSSDLIVQASPLLTGEQARTTGRRALANYLASALLFPYAPFLAAAEDWRYDIERLAHHFGGSFEQTAHRLVTLRRPRSEEHTSELPSLMRISYAVFCLKKKNTNKYY